MGIARRPTTAYRTHDDAGALFHIGVSHHPAVRFSVLGETAVPAPDA
ncbi:hypothetical protein AB0D24_04905 [Streptomyces javensis]